MTRVLVPGSKSTISFFAICKFLLYVVLLTVDVFGRYDCIAFGTLLI